MHFLVHTEEHYPDVKYHGEQSFSMRVSREKKRVVLSLCLNMKKYTFNHHEL